jgi:DNA repair protein RAD16
VLSNQPACPVCHLALTIDLEAPALELEENVSTARQGILGRLDLDNWRSSSKIEALVEELSTLRSKDATTKSIVFSQFVNFLDLIAFRLQRAGFNVHLFSLWSCCHSSNLPDLSTGRHNVAPSKRCHYKTF